MFNQNIISNKFDLNLSTTLSSYKCGYDCLCHANTLITKTAELKIENLAQITLRFFPVICDLGPMF
jgi:hypothetical protein